MIVELWHENRGIFKAMIGDIFGFGLVLSGLYVIHLLLAQLEHAGYERWKVQMLETVHFYGLLVVVILMIVALGWEMIHLLFWRKDRKR